VKSVMRWDTGLDMSVVDAVCSDCVLTEIVSFSITIAAMSASFHPIDYNGASGCVNKKRDE